MPRKRKATDSPEPQQRDAKKEALPEEGLFPFMLHGMVESCTGTPDEAVLAWMPDGMSFIVKDRKRFVEDILPRFTKQTKFKSFQRQLNLWGFQTPNHGRHDPSVGGTIAYHPKFIRGARHLCTEIKLGELSVGEIGDSRTSVVASQQASSASSLVEDTKPAARGAERKSDAPESHAAIRLDVRQPPHESMATAPVHGLPQPLFGLANDASRLPLLETLLREQAERQRTSRLLAELVASQQRHEAAAAANLDLLQRVRNATSQNPSASALPTYGLPFLGGVTEQVQGQQAPPGSGPGNPYPGLPGLLSPSNRSDDELLLQLLSQPSIRDALLQQLLAGLSPDQILSLLMAQRNRGFSSNAAQGRDNEEPRAEEGDQP